MSNDDYDPDSELGAPRVIHNHYSQSRNGNGNGVLVKIFIGLCGFMLTVLVGMQGFMWRSQLDFQNEMTDRVARIETRLESLNND